MATKAKTDDGGGGFAALAARSISTSDFAALVGISPEALRLRVAAGEIPKLGHGKLNLLAAVRGFIAGEEKRIEVAATRANDGPRGRYNARRAAEIEKRLAREGARLIAREEADLALSQVTGIVTAEIAALGAKHPEFDPAIFEGAAARIERTRAQASAGLLSGDLGQ
jgi:hypothetical protein